jgi:hypothetical protein
MYRQLLNPTAYGNGRRLFGQTLMVETSTLNSKLPNVALLNTGMNSRFPNCYKPSMMSFVTSSEKLIHTLNQQRP